MRHLQMMDYCISYDGIISNDARLHSAATMTGATATAPMPDTASAVADLPDSRGRHTSRRNPVGEHPARSGDAEIQPPEDFVTGEPE